MVRVAKSHHPETETHFVSDDIGEHSQLSNRTSAYKDVVSHLEHGLKHETIQSLLSAPDNSTLNAVTQLYTSDHFTRLDKVLHFGIAAHRLLLARQNDEDGLPILGFFAEDTYDDYVEWADHLLPSRIASLVKAAANMSLQSSTACKVVREHARQTFLTEVFIDSTCVPEVAAYTVHPKIAYAWTSPAIWHDRIRRADFNAWRILFRKNVRYRLIDEYLLNKDYMYFWEAAEPD